MALADRLVDHNPRLWVESGPSAWLTNGFDEMAIVDFGGEF